MSFLIKPIIEVVQIANAATTYFTAPVPTRIEQMVVHNPTGAAASVTIYWVPSGGAAGATNALVTTRFVQSLETFIVTPFIGQVLAVGDFIAALASAATTLNFAASGTEITT